MYSHVEQVGPVKQPTHSQVKFVQDPGRGEHMPLN